MFMGASSNDSAADERAVAASREDASGGGGDAAFAEANASPPPEGVPPTGAAGAVTTDVALKKYYLQCAVGVPLSRLRQEHREWADNACRQFDTEATILSALAGHPNIIQCFGVALGEIQLTQSRLKTAISPQKLCIRGLRVGSSVNASMQSTAIESSMHVWKTLYTEWESQAMFARRSAFYYVPGPGVSAAVSLGFAALRGWR